MAIYLCFQRNFLIDHHCTISSIKQNCMLFTHRGQQSWRKVIFSVMCVCQSVFPQWWITHDALNSSDMLKLVQLGPHCRETPLTPVPSVQRPLAQTQPFLLMTSGGQDWIPVQTCSLERTPWCWHLVASKACTGPTGMLSCFIYFDGQMHELAGYTLIKLFSMSTCTTTDRDSGCRCAKILPEYLLVSVAVVTSVRWTSQW